MRCALSCVFQRQSERVKLIRGVIREVVIRRKRRRAAGVTDARAKNTWMTPEPGIGGPESTERECRGVPDVWGAMRHDIPTVVEASSYCWRVDDLQFIMEECCKRSKLLS